MDGRISTLWTRSGAASLSTVSSSMDGEFSERLQGSGSRDDGISTHLTRSGAASSMDGGISEPLWASSMDGGIAERSGAASSSMASGE